MSGSPQCDVNNTHMSFEQDKGNICKHMCKIFCMFSSYIV